MYRSLTDFTLPNLYASPIVTAACNEISRNYNRPLSDIRDMVLADESITLTVDGIQGAICEYIMWDMFRMLKDNGWDIKFLDEKKEVNGVIVKPFGPGKRVNLKNTNVYMINGELDGKETELDILVKVNSEDVIGESKAGEGSFNYGDATKRVQMIRPMLDKDPSFVLGVPRGHGLLKYGMDRIFKNRGGRILVFSRTRDDYMHMAQDIHTTKLSALE
jgi:hypothetical protein